MTMSHGLVSFSKNDGLAGYDRVVSTIVSAVALLKMHTTIRLEALDTGGVALSPEVAAQLRDL